MLEIISEQFDKLSSNQFLVGGTLLGLLGASFALMRKVPGHIYQYVKRRIIATLEIDSRDECYQWVQIWLGSRKDTRFRDVRAVIQWKDSDSGLNTKAVPDPIFSPAPGVYLVKYNGKRLLVSVVTEDQKSDGIIMGERKKFFIQKFGPSQHLFRDLIIDAYKAYSPDDKNTIRIFHPHTDYWEEVDEKKPRRKDSLICDGDMLERLSKDLENFANRRKWYEKMCIPYRRGYLFYGPPGNGKSSLALYMASELDCDIYVLSLTSVANDKELTSMVSKIPHDCLLLLEDVDAAFRNRDKVDPTKGITFSGLLNVLDGVMATEGRILVMTTNHKDLLDPALIRTGRADVHEYIGNASTDQIVRMFIRFFENSTVEQQQKFAQIVKPDVVGMSKLQEFLLSQSSASEAVQNAVYLNPIEIVHAEVAA